MVVVVVVVGAGDEGRTINVFIEESVSALCRCLFFVRRYQQCGLERFGKLLHHPFRLSYENASGN